MFTLFPSFRSRLEFCGGKIAILIVPSEFAAPEKVLVPSLSRFLFDYLKLSVIGLLRRIIEWCWLILPVLA